MTSKVFCKGILQGGMVVTEEWKAGFATPPQIRLHNLDMSSSFHTRFTPFQNILQPQRGCRKDRATDLSGLRRSQGQTRNSRQPLCLHNRGSKSAAAGQSLESCASYEAAQTKQAAAAVWVALKVLRRLITRVFLALSLAVLTWAAVPSWAAVSTPYGGRQLYAQEVHLVARADENTAFIIPGWNRDSLVEVAGKSTERTSEGNEGTIQEKGAGTTTLLEAKGFIKEKFDNVRAWHKVWGGEFDQIPIWANMAREHVVMRGLHTSEEATTRAIADEIHAVWTNPLQYIYVMSYGTTTERIDYLARFHAPAPQGKVHAATSGTHTDAATMHDALLEANRQQKTSAPAEAEERGALTGRLIAAGIAFSLVAMLRSPPSQFPDSWRETNFNITSSSLSSSNTTAAAAAPPKWSAAPPLDAGAPAASVTLLAQRAALYTPPVTYDYVIIGAGASGLAAAQFALSFRAKTLLIEEDRRGGQCTNDGCIASKALLHAAARVAAARAAGELLGGTGSGGVTGGGGAALSAPPGTQTLSREEVEKLRREGDAGMSWAARQLVGSAAQVQGDTAIEALERGGLSVLRGKAKFESTYSVGVMHGNGSKTVVQARRFLICTGAEAEVPEVRGLSGIKYWTPAEVLRNPPQTLPRSMVVLGGGPQGCELAQAFQMLGCDVTIVAPLILPRESPRAQAAAAQLLVNGSGVRWVQARAETVLKRMPGEVTVILHDKRVVVGAQLLVTCGRKARVKELALAAAGVEYGKQGIWVDKHQRTSAYHIMAAGDCCAANPVELKILDDKDIHPSDWPRAPQTLRVPQNRSGDATRAGGRRQEEDRFAHSAGWQAFIATKTALLPFWLRWSVGIRPPLVPRVTYTQPEVAAVGLSATEAEALHGPVGRDWWRISVDADASDRAVCDGESVEGFVEVYIHRSGRVLGASIVSNRAGELIALVAVAIQNRLNVRDLMDTLHPYPSYAYALHKVWVEAASRELSSLSRNPLPVLLGLLHGRPPFRRMPSKDSLQVK